MNDYSEKSNVDLQVGGARLSVAGPALAVIALVAVLGIIWLSGKLIDLNERAIVKPEMQPTIMLPAG